MMGNPTIRDLLRKGHGEIQSLNGGGCGIEFRTQPGGRKDGGPVLFIRTTGGEWKAPPWAFLALQLRFYAKVESPRQKEKLLAFLVEELS